MKNLIDSISKFLVPEREISLKLFGDNLRTLGVAIAILYFANNFYTIGKFVSELYCQTNPLLCEITISNKDGSSAIKLVPSAIRAMVIAAKCTAIFMLILAVLQAWVITYRLDDKNDFSFKLQSSDSDSLFGTLIQIFTFFYALSATIIGLAISLIAYT